MGAGLGHGGIRGAAACADGALPRASRANAHAPDATAWTVWRADLEDAEDEDEDEEGRGKQSRSEKKSRKAMQKLGMKPVPGIIRCTVKKSKNVRPKPAEPISAHTMEWFS